MKKTLLDLFLSASKAALSLVDADAHEVETKKMEAFNGEKHPPSDFERWYDFFMGELQRYKNLKKELAPSAKVVPAPTPTAPVAK